MRVHIHCSDCVAGLDVTAESWVGFAGLFTHDYDACGSATWIAPAGEWKLQIEDVGRDLLTITSELDSMLDFHRWVLRTNFSMSRDRFRDASANVLAFIGTLR